MSLEKEVGKFTTVKDKLKGFYDEYIFGGDDLEKAEDEAMASLYQIKTEERLKLFEEDLKNLFEENGRGKRFIDLKKKHGK